MKKTTIRMPVATPPAAADQWVAQSGNDVSEGPKAAAVVPLKQPTAAPAPTEVLKRLTIDMPESLHRRVKIGCTMRGTKMNELIRELLEREFPE
ncbi:plasmid partition protein ParG (plasmid) [Rhizobium sp. CB3171]|uniref:plasmid partition protein ParG n=1 Tax=Rhizobium sp. CB3171 TaxID=3039157 RepID=UPI0024B1891B|nr:plasmid partition protein ParG [Rhizobium sp. CB3171]WFU07538.1 plasmid partition protein ParG [Rhizobium sp. CB3171]